ncbi:MAG TPA: metalloregulator ArsR/SmtB family transcription factor [Thermomicrobiales bacterium]|nr:metalloregulator ArsR/SmtB family transcription factor [Thermomicrobiales bacterium]
MRTFPKPLIEAERDWEVDAIHPRAVMEARRTLRNAAACSDVASLFAVLGDPTRIRVLTALAAGELCVCDLAAATGVNRSTVSHQLRVLRTHRLVRRRREGKVAYYALDDDHVLQLLAVAGEHSSETGAGRKEVTA